MTSAAAINLFFFLCSSVYTCFCHWSPSIMVRMNGQPFSPQLGRHIGKQSQHFQYLLWHIYHDSKIDRYVHIITVVLDILIWTLFACFYLPSWMQTVMIFFLIMQAISKRLIFPRSVTGNIKTDLAKDDINPHLIAECIHCDFEHSYPNELRHFYLWIKISWFRVHRSSLGIDWKEHHISLCTSLFWILLFSAMHYLLSNNYISTSHLTILHILIPINALLRALGHILEPVPPFIGENEHFLDDSGFPFIIGFLRRGLIFPVIRLIFIGLISEYQAGLLYALPQVFLHECFTRVLRPLEEKLAKEHYHHQARIVRLKGWKSTVLTEAMYRPFFKTH